MKLFRFRYLIFSLPLFFLFACGHDDPQPTPVPPDPDDNKQDENKEVVLKPEDVPNYEKIYMCSEFYKNKRGWDITNTFYDPLKSTSFYYFGRSKQSEHFIIFWDKDYGTTTPDEAASPYHLDTDAFLEWCEKIYAHYIDVLKFANYKDGYKSYLDQYKFQVYLWHQTEWAAYGSGPADNITGCLWVNPEAANSRSTVAHEIGHSFQYQTACDLILNGVATDIDKVAFRYNQGNGSTFWEQCAQWKSFQMCPEEVFSNYDFTTFCDNCNRHFAHEDMRYGSYFFQYYWTDKYGIDAVAKVWREARAPKDALESYMSSFGIAVDEFNEQVYDYAARVATWDFDALRNEGVNHAGAVSWKGTPDGDGYYTVAPAKALESTGFNIIRVNDVVPGKELKAEFTGLPNAAGFNASGDASVAGWKIGFVSLGKDGKTRTYSDHVTATAVTENSATVSWTVPSDAKFVWAVVACTPTSYITHLWDDNNSNDRHWPYKVRFSCDGSVIDMTAPMSGNLTGADGSLLNSTYSWKIEDQRISVDVDIDTDQTISRKGFEIGHFDLSIDKINAALGVDVRDLDESSFVGYNPDGKATDFTSYKPGMWAGTDGKATSWSEGAAFWQWYVWGGKTDKNGEKTWYDYDTDGTGANAGRFMVGTNPDNVSKASGKTIVFNNKITAGKEIWDFVVTYKFS